MHLQFPQLLRSSGLWVAPPSVEVDALQVRSLQAQHRLGDGIHSLPGMHSRKAVLTSSSMAL